MNNPTDLFEIHNEVNGHSQAYRTHIEGNAVSCAFHLQTPGYMYVVGHEIHHDVYGIKCPVCGVRAFAVRKQNN